MSLSHNTRTTEKKVENPNLPKTNKRSFFFFMQCIIRLWNALPHNIKKVKNFARLKEGWEAYM